MDNKEKFLFAVAQDLVNELVLQLQRNGSVDTGQLKQSIDIHIDRGNVVIFMEDYWGFLEYGTKPHEIRVKNKQALHFEKGGNDVFATVVHHPGTQPKPFIRPVIHTKLKEIVNRHRDLLAK